MALWNSFFNNNTSGMNTGTNNFLNFGSTNNTAANQNLSTANQYSLYGQGNNAQTMQNSSDMLQSTQTNTGMSTSDMLNFGTSLANLGLGAYFQNESLGIQQDTLDLSQQEYDDYVEDQENLDEVSAERAAAAKANTGQS